MEYSSIKQKEEALMKTISSDTYYFTETAMGSPVYQYLLIGENNALLIDTGYGMTDIPKAIRELTELPLIVINTHGHFDHARGNYLYPSVLQHQKEEEVWRRHKDPQYLKGLLDMVIEQNGLSKDILQDPAMKIDYILAEHSSQEKPLPESGMIELGNRCIRIIETPGHTAGSICLLDEKNKWLFVGDTACRDGVLLQFPESTSVERYLQTIRNMKELVEREGIRELFPGHQETPVSPDILNMYENNCLAILAGRLTEEERKTGRYGKGIAEIAFRKDRIRDMKEIGNIDSVRSQDTNLIYRGVLERPRWSFEKRELVPSAYERLEDGRICFRLFYPMAKDVRIILGSTPAQNILLQKEEDLWTGYADPADGILVTDVIVDGNHVLNDRLPIYYQSNKPMNMINLLEEDNPAIPRTEKTGQIVQDYFRSSHTGRWERILVYLPYGYVRNQETYPVLYLQHGFGENETVWSAIGKMNFICDNLIAEGKMVPSIVVMSNGMLVYDEDVSVRVGQLAEFEQLLMDVIAHVESTYRVYQDKKHRALAGLSMGSLQTSYISFKHPELFSAIGVFSGFVQNWLTGEHEHCSEENLANFQNEPHVYFRAMGDVDEFLDYFLKDDELLKKAGISCIREIYHGAHEWKVWQQCLCRFVQLIFRGEGNDAKR